MSTDATQYPSDGELLRRAMTEVQEKEARIEELEAAIRDEVIEPFDDGLGVASSNYRRLREVLDRGATGA